MVFLGNFQRKLGVVNSFVIFAVCRLSDDYLIFILMAAYTLR
ncbi:hypothetical protein CLV50_2890 [Flavobacterium lindanitolerans]|jgi:hypothetical protein|uniref:Uncharacterized protein n=1 Tax=Flavobacterium lindanitolerans TaxID=428988 RepID=A0A497U5I2_9FLAO|nr:hypothetical protein B0G92_3138 [Flavobacterium lindanitolerans]RLJ23618.1 hypothetical protein CLV50_2890 [Flavobacterium lindanitolerans]